MKQINYSIWAHIIRFFLFTGICFQLIGFSVSLIKDVFNLETDFSIYRFDYGYRDFKNGYPVKASMTLEIPDTVMQGQKGTIERVFDRGMAYDWFYDDSLRIGDTIINRLKPQSIYSTNEKQHREIAEKVETDSTKNRIAVSQPITIRVKTNNSSHKWFYIAYGQLDKFFMIFIFIWLIKLLNSYLRGTFITVRSFNLIARIGYAFIWMNIISGVFRWTNTFVLPDFDLVSRSKQTGQLVNHIKLTLSPNNLNFDFTYILIGVSILILGDVIKNAILIRKENDLTI